MREVGLGIPLIVKGFVGPTTTRACYDKGLLYTCKAAGFDTVQCHCNCPGRAGGGGHITDPLAAVRIYINDEQEE